MSIKSNRDCPMCEAKDAMIYNPKKEYKLEFGGDQLVVFGDGWDCSECGRGGSFPDDEDLKMKEPVGEMLTVRNLIAAGQFLQDAYENLKKYGQHMPACSKVLARLRDEEAPCTCGFDEAVV